MVKHKRTYPMEFKQETLHLLATSGKSVRQIEEDLGITPGLLRKWKERYELDAETGAVKARIGASVRFLGLTGTLPCTNIVARYRSASTPLTESTMSPLSAYAGTGV